jgi:hypothetical protein
MNQLIGKKGKGLEPGYVWVPYLIEDKPVIVDSNFSPKMTLSSRYSSTIVSPKIEKIKKILEKIEDLVSN